MADQFKKDQGSNFNRDDRKSMPSQGQQDQKRSSSTDRPIGSQQQRNETGAATGNVKRSTQEDLDE